MSKKLLKLLDDHFSDSCLWHNEDETRRLHALVKAELAKPEQQPVAWFLKKENTGKVLFHEDEIAGFIAEGYEFIQKLYASPPNREPLSEDEIIALLTPIAKKYNQSLELDDADMEFIRAIEDAINAK